MDAVVRVTVTDQALVDELAAANSLVFHMAARMARVDRVASTSSASIYGNPRSIPINEDDQIVPLSPYAVSKLAGENYSQAFYESHGLPTACVRYSNV